MVSEVRRAYIRLLEGMYIARKRSITQKKHVSFAILKRTVLSIYSSAVSMQTKYGSSFFNIQLSAHLLCLEIYSDSLLTPLRMPSSISSSPDFYFKRQSTSYGNKEIQGCILQV